MNADGTCTTLQGLLVVLTYVDAPKIASNPGKYQFNIARIFATAAKKA